MIDVTAVVSGNRRVADGIYEMTLRHERFGAYLGGQFVNVKLSDSSRVLRRPFCICDFDAQKHEITICYAIVGEGTRILSACRSGDRLQTLLPLGNGFAPRDEWKKIALVGGGMGAAVLPAVARADAGSQREYYAYLGFADRDKVVLQERLGALCKAVRVATDDGSYGAKGFVTDLLAADMERLRPDVVFCCGPEVMYRALAKTLAPYGVPVYVSLEQRMGCGVGACLVCSCKIRRNGEEGYLRVCKDGPVFALDEVVL